MYPFDYNDNPALVVGGGSRAADRCAAGHVETLARTPNNVHAGA